ncbi:MAG TPA: hypothetical protein VFL14_08175 [Xanthomonadales bacterium]|nr:hypothetical protein [Xanthomonadales bacterium]
MRALLVAALAGASGEALAQAASTPGTPVAPSPTIANISVVWPLAGDDDADGVVSVRFRAVGAPAWRTGMPLRRIPAGTNAEAGFSWPNRHAGSLFDLAPATSYEIELTLDDPDGGSTQAVIQATTRAVPTAGTIGVVRPALPATLAGVLAIASPGDIVELGAGTYAGFQVTRDGTPGQPITLRGTPGALVTGEIGIFNRHDVRVESLAITGRVRFNGTRNFALVGCTIVATSAFGGDGVVSFLRAEDAYIADNTITGLTAWAESSFGASGNNLGEGIAVTGPGHVVVRNRVSGFRDALSLLEGSEAVDQYSIDFLDNVVSEAADDGMEADFCFHDCRIMRNRFTNTFIAMSSQPGLGGPTYFIRNTAYNVVHVPFKLYRGSVGDVVLHNTIVKHGDPLNAYPGRPISRALFRNNLLLGGPSGTFNGFDSGSGRITDLATLETANSSLDYDGFGTTLPAFTGRIGAVTYNGFAQLVALTSEQHARQVGYDVFANGVAFPATPTFAYAPVDLALAPGGAAVDAGVVIPNVDDGYGGNAPDLGAFELGGGGGAELPLFANGFE